jgi:hypothetical protein
LDWRVVEPGGESAGLDALMTKLLTLKSDNGGNGAA